MEPENVEILAYALFVTVLAITWPVRERRMVTIPSFIILTGFLAIMYGILYDAGIVAVRERLSVQGLMMVSIFISSTLIAKVWIRSIEHSAIAGGLVGLMVLIIVEVLF